MKNLSFPSNVIDFGNRRSHTSASGAKPEKVKKPCSCEWRRDGSGNGIAPLLTTQDACAYLVAEPGAMMKARLSIIEGVNNRVKKRFALALHEPHRSVDVFPRALDKMREEERVSFEEAVMALKLTNRQRRCFYHFRGTLTEYDVYCPKARPHKRPSRKCLPLGLPPCERRAPGRRPGRPFPRRHSRCPGPVPPAAEFKMPLGLWRDSVGTDTPARRYPCFLRHGWP
jgi:hypothetical protein